MTLTCVSHLGNEVPGSKKNNNNNNVVRMLLRYVIKQHLNPTDPVIFFRMQKNL